jgi:ribosomal protein S18 acetylase RimI-like enzyme
MTKAPRNPPELTPEQEERIRRAREQDALGREMYESARRRYFEARERLLELARRR